MKRKTKIKKKKKSQINFTCCFDPCVGAVNSNQLTQKVCDFCFSDSFDVFKAIISCSKKNYHVFDFECSIIKYIMSLEEMDTANELH